MKKQDFAHFITSLMFGFRIAYLLSIAKLRLNLLLLH